jgi:hypothetical protein
MLHAVFQAYAQTGLSEAVRESRWIFAVFEMVHLAALALLGGAALVAGGRLADWTLGGASRAAVWHGLRPAALVGLAGVIGSGVILVGVNPLKYYFNPSFNVKIALLIGFILLGLLADRLLDKGRLTRSLGVVIGLLLPLLLLGVGLAGRAIGLL